jgi:hypothetical protein
MPVVNGRGRGAATSNRRSDGNATSKLQEVAPSHRELMLGETRFDRVILGRTRSDPVRPDTTLCAIVELSRTDPGTTPGACSPGPRPTPDFSPSFRDTSASCLSRPARSAMARSLPLFASLLAA